MCGVRTLTIGLNVAVLCALVPLAHATPPDPTYLAGLWDDADYDDVVALVTSSVTSIDTYALSDLIQPLVLVALVLPVDEGRLHPDTTSPHPPRAPPAV